ncbi:pentatricopeptide repeat-containing protein [Tanacetum coccineum]
MATRGRKKAIAEPTPPARYPRDVETIERLQQRIKLKFIYKINTNRKPNQNLLSKDIGDEEDEYPFVNEYPSFKEEPIIFLEDESCPVYDIDNEEAESMPVYDTNIKDFNEEEGKCYGKVDKALDIVEKLETKELKPNFRTYNELISGSIIEAICKQGSVEEAHTLLDSLKEKGIKVNEVIYTTLIDGYFQKGKADSGTNLFLEMLITGCLPNSWTYTESVFYEVLFRSWNCFLGRISKFLDDIYDLMSGKKGELLSLFSVESMIKKELDQNIHALATALENGKSCAREDTTRVQIALSDMRSLSNLFAVSR